MEYWYESNPVLVTRIYYVEHKGRAPDTPVRLHHHNPLTHELVYVDYGQVNFQVNKKQFQLNSGECIFVRGRCNHAFAGEEGTPFQFLNIMFRGKVPKKLFNRKLKVDSECRKLLVKLREESGLRQEYQDEVLFSYLTLLIVNLYRQEMQYTPRVPVLPAYYQNYQSEIVRRVMDIIIDHYMEPLTLPRVAKAVGVSRSQLCQLLKRETSRSFSDLLMEQRLVTAKYLLHMDKLSIAGIAEAVGWSNSFFFRAFRRSTGMSPRVYAESLGDVHVQEMSSN